MAEILTLILFAIGYAHTILCTGTESSINNTSTIGRNSNHNGNIQDRQLGIVDAGPQCGISGAGGNDPFGLQDQFNPSTMGTTSTTPLTTTTAIADARLGLVTGVFSSDIVQNFTMTGFPGKSGQGPQPNNDIFFTGLGPILENDSAIAIIDGAPWSKSNNVGEGKRQVIPRILKRDVSVAAARAPVLADGHRLLHVALPNQLCWQVQIETQIRLSTSRFAVSTCAGAIIEASTILTAAHCVLNPVSLSQSSTLQQAIAAEDISVSVGLLSADTCLTESSPASSNCSEKFSLSKVVKHPGYNPVLGDNDIALLLLSKPINFAAMPCACALCLVNKAPSIGESCMVGGFGDDLFIANRSLASLKWTNIKTRQASATSSSCGFNVDDTTGKMTDLDQFVCAGGTQGESSCQGDSGGPLVCRNPVTGSHYLAGIAAFGPPCGVNIGAMYTSVSRFLPWIVTNRAGGATV